MTRKPTETQDGSDLPAAESPDIVEEGRTLEVRRGDRIRRMEFASEEDRRNWKKASRKRRLYLAYFLVGVGINAVLYLLGLDLSDDLLRGLLVGMGVPIATMFFLSELHYRLFVERSEG